MTTKTYTRKIDMQYQKMIYDLSEKNEQGEIVKVDIDKALEARNRLIAEIFDMTVEEVENLPVHEYNKLDQEIDRMKWGDPL